MKIVEYFGVCATDVLQIVIQLHRIQRTENIGSFYEKVQYEDILNTKKTLFNCNYCKIGCKIC